MVGGGQVLCWFRGSESSTRAGVHVCVRLCHGAAVSVCPPSGHFGAERCPGLVATCQAPSSLCAIERRACAHMLF